MTSTAVTAEPVAAPATQTPSVAWARMVHEAQTVFSGKEAAAPAAINMLRCHKQDFLFYQLETEKYGRIMLVLTAAPSSPNVQMMVTQEPVKVLSATAVELPALRQSFLREQKDGNPIAFLQAGFSYVVRFDRTPRHGGCFRRHATRALTEACYPVLYAYLRNGPEGVKQLACAKETTEHQVEEANRPLNRARCLLRKALRLGRG